MRFHGISSALNPQSDADQPEAAADQAIAACNGDSRSFSKNKLRVICFAHFWSPFRAMMT